METSSFSSCAIYHAWARLLFCVLYRYTYSVSFFLFFFVIIPAENVGDLLSLFSSRFNGGIRRGLIGAM